MTGLSEIKIFYSGIMLVKFIFIEEKER